MTRVELPEGNWADLRSPRKVAERKRRAYFAAIEDYQAVGGTGTRSGTNLALLEAITDTMILCLVSSWSYQPALSAEALGDLDAEVYDALRRACLPLAPELSPDLGPSLDPIPAVDGSSPSPPASSVAAG